MRRLLFITIISLIAICTKAQENNPGSIHGNFQLDAQTYAEDNSIGATKADEIMLSNVYANFIYTKGDFSAGTRFEGYLNTLQGFEPQNEGVGFPYRWIRYSANDLEITVGSYYEQFGAGMIFRTYEAKTLGYDNAMDGIRLKYRIGSGIILKAIYGQQRQAQKYVNDVTQLMKGRGIVRGIDAEISVNDIFNSLAEKKTRVLLGGSFISKHEKDDNPIYKIPENVGAGAGRLNISHGKINFSGEYVYKSMDPSSGGTEYSNGIVGHNYIYKNGQGLLLTASYSQKGLGIHVMAKSIDNMNFRSERTAKLNDLNINFIPDINKNHTYSLASIYPYGTQPNGEAGIKAELMYKFKKESILGGKYGTLVNVGYSRMNSLQKKALSDTSILASNDGTLGYKSNLLSIGDELYYEDINLEISKKVNRKLKGILTLQSLKYNNSIIHGAGLYEGIINSFVIVLDLTYKFTKKKAVRTEFQQLQTKEDKGNWSLALFEFSIPHWFFIVGDQYNANSNQHYYNVAIVHNFKANRIQIGYGKQREGIVCTGGVCRRVPAANGFTVSLTSSF